MSEWGKFLLVLRMFLQEFCSVGLPGEEYKQWIGLFFHESWGRRISTNRPESHGHCYSADFRIMLSEEYVPSLGMTFNFIFIRISCRAACFGDCIYRAGSWLATCPIREAALCSRPSADTRTCGLRGGCANSQLRGIRVLVCPLLVAFVWGAA